MDRVALWARNDIMDRRWWQDVQEVVVPWSRNGVMDRRWWHLQTGGGDAMEKE